MFDTDHQHPLFPDDVVSKRWPWSMERSGHLEHPSVTAGNRVYSVSTQHGEFSEIGWRQPKEMSGVWDPPMKLLDGFWFGVTPGHSDAVGSAEKVHWLTEADRWCLAPGEVEMVYSGQEWLPGLEVVRQEYGVDDQEGLLVRLRLSNRGTKEMSLVVHFLAHTDLRTAWLGENRLIWRDGQDEAVFLVDEECIAAYNTINPAYVLFGAQLRPFSVAIGGDAEKMVHTSATKGVGTRFIASEGISGHLRYAISLPPASSEEVMCIIAGSTRSSSAKHAFAAALKTFRDLKTSFEELARRQCERYQQVIARNALRCDDELMETAFGWAKVNLQMLERVVPRVGQGLCAGLPDFPWWFGKDTTYSVLPLVASGQFELALSSLRNLAQHSQTINGEGGVVHEILTQGHIYDPGHLVEVPLFVRACAYAFRWTGDRAFLRDVYDFCRCGLLNWVLMMHDDDGDLYAMGKGLVESRELQYGRGFKTLDIAVYTYEALLCLAELAPLMGDEALVPELYEKAQRIRDGVNADWWMAEEGLFGDIYTSARALSTVHEALRAEKPLWPGDVAEMKESSRLLAQFAEKHEGDTSAFGRQRPWLLKHMIAATPMETGLALPDHAERAFDRLEGDEFTGPWGIYLNPERQRVTMTLPNGVMAAAEARYGRMDQALAYSHKIAVTVALRMPGAFSEVSPDEGCFIQAWSSYGVIWPVIHYFFGFRPDAGKQTLRCIPHFPASWHTARLADMRVGTADMGATVVDVAVARAERSVQVVLETSDSSYGVMLGYMWSAMGRPLAVTLNGEAVDFQLTVMARTKEGDTVWELSLPHRTGLHRYVLRLLW